MTSTDIYDDCPANVAVLNIPSANYKRINVYTNCNSIDQFYGIWIIAGGPNITFDDDNVAEFQVAVPKSEVVSVDFYVSKEDLKEADWEEYLIQTNPDSVLEVDI